MEELSLPLLIGWAAFALAFLLPGHYLPWTMFQQEAVAAVAGLLLCVAALEKSSQVVWPRTAVLALVLAIVPWVQFAAGQIRFLTDALLSSVYLVALGCAIVTGATFTAGPRRGQWMHGLAAACVAAAFVSTGIALHQWLDLPVPWLWITALIGARPFGNLAQPNHLASLLALGVAGVLWWYETRRVHGAITSLALLWLGWGLAMTQSRTAWLFVALLATGTLLMKRRAGLRTPPIAVGLAVFVFASMLLADGPMRAGWLQMSSDAAGVLRTQAGTRLIHWSALTEAALRSPWVGYGWQQVAHAQWDVALTTPPSGEALMHSHNLLLDLVLYNGLPQGVLIFGSMVWWVLRTLRCVRGPDAWCQAVGLIALLSHALVEYPLHYLYFLLPAGWLVGSLSILATPTAVQTKRAARVSLALPVLVLASLLVVISIDYIRAEEALRRLRFATARIGIPMTDLTAPDLLILDGWYHYHEAARKVLTPNLSDADVMQLHDVARRFPYPPAIQRYAHALALRGEGVASQDTLRRLCQIYPQSVQAVMREAWRETQRTSPLADAVAFPDC